MWASLQGVRAGIGEQVTKAGCIASAKYGQDSGEWERGRRKSGSLG